jgi:hypothetical protein
MILKPFLPPEVDLSQPEAVTAALVAHCGHDHILRLEQASTEVAKAHLLYHTVGEQGAQVLGLNPVERDCDLTHAFLDWVGNTMEKAMAAVYN